MEKTSFSSQVYALCRQIPQGKVTTYKALAMALGTKAYQAVGNALRCNPYAPHVPCHRVVASNGSIGGFKGHTSGGQVDEKIALLSQEGVIVKSGMIDLQHYLFDSFDINSQKTI